MTCRFLIVAGGAWLVAAAGASAQTWVAYGDIGPDLLNYEATYPNLCRRYDLGSSVQGRSLWAMRISDNMPAEEDEPEIKYISTMHGDEITGATMCMYLIDDLLTNYGTDAQVTRLVDEADIWIVPLMNPDGYDRSPRSRYNAVGVDLNRDFPNLGDPNTTAGRAVETGHIMNWTAANSFDLSANYHGGALVVNYPFDNEDTGSRYSPDDDLFVWMSETYSQLNPPMWNSPVFFHGVTNGADWYIIHGSMQDWSYHFHGCNEVTIEVSNNKQPPASQIPQFWSENRDAMLAYMDTVLIGVRGLVTDGVTGLPLAATVTVVGRNHEVYTDPDVGDYHRMLLPGTYDLLVTAAGYDPEARTGVVVGAGDATRLDVQMYAAPRVVSPNGGEALTAGAPATITWMGNPAARFHVQYTENATAVTVVTDDFEGGTLGPDYATGGGANWFVTTTSAHTGVRSARAGGITHNQTTWMTRNADGGSMSFWYRVSSETNYDFFNFYIDGVRDLHLSGTIGWAQYTKMLTPGTHQLKWEYTKDFSVSSGSDTVWIDDVELVAGQTVWADVVPLTAPGAMSTPWTPVNVGDDYKVRVRSYLGGSYGPWDDSDAVFSVGGGPPADGDPDGDGDVDLNDFAAFQLCSTGAPTAECLAAFDFEPDGDVDVTDYAAFAALISGP